MDPMPYDILMIIDPITRFLRAWIGKYKNAFPFVHGLLAVLQNEEKGRSEKAWTLCG